MLLIADLQSCNINGVCIGHFVPLAKMYLDLFRGHADVKVAGGPIYAKSIPEKDLLRLPYDVKSGVGRVRNRVRFLLNARSLFRSCAVGDKIVLQDGLPFANHLAMLLFYRGKGDVYMIKYSKHGCESFLDRFIYGLIKGKIAGVICPNDDVGKFFGKPYCVVPDYIYSGDYINRGISYEDKTYDFCVVGRLNEDKGVVETAKYMASTGYSVLIAGQADDEYAAKLRGVCEGHPEIDLRLGYVSDEDYRNYIRSSRFCLLNYQGEYANRSSGVVFDIVFNDVPVVGNNCKALNFIKEEGLGYIYDSIDSVDFDGLMNRQSYDAYLDRIEKYKAVNRQNLETLSGFLGV